MNDELGKNEYERTINIYLKRQDKLEDEEKEDEEKNKRKNKRRK